MNAKNEIVKIIQSMTGKYSAYTIFSDWVEMSAIAIQNNSVIIHDEVWKKREKQYMDTAKKYNSKELENMSKMFSLLVEALEENIEDVLGDVYIKSGCYSKQLGQFFTPFHLAYLLAKTAYHAEEMINNEVITLNEPSTGGGANIIAYAKVLHDNGINYQNKIKVVAQDLDWLAVYMSYVQFSLLGINGEIAQGDTLREPYGGNGFPAERIFRTPKRMGALI